MIRDKRGIGSIFNSGLQKEKDQMVYGSWKRKVRKRFGEKYGGVLFPEQDIGEYEEDPIDYDPFGGGGPVGGGGSASGGGLIGGGGGITTDAVDYGSRDLNQVFGGVEFLTDEDGNISIEDASRQEINRYVLKNYGTHVEVFEAQISLIVAEGLSPSDAVKLWELFAEFCNGLGKNIQMMSKYAAKLAKDFKKFAKSIEDAFPKLTKAIKAFKIFKAVFKLILELIRDGDVKWGTALDALPFFLDDIIKLLVKWTSDDAGEQEFEERLKEGILETFKKKYIELKGKWNQGFEDYYRGLIWGMDFQ